MVVVAASVVVVMGRCRGARFGLGAVRVRCGHEQDERNRHERHRQHASDMEKSYAHV